MKTLLFARQADLVTLALDLSHEIFRCGMEANFASIRNDLILYLRQATCCFVDGEFFVLHLFTPSLESSCMMIISYNIRWKLPSKVFGSLTTTNGLTDCYHIT